MYSLSHHELESLDDEVGLERRNFNGVYIHHRGKRRRGYDVEPSSSREKNRCSSAYGSIEETIIVYRRGENSRESNFERREEPLLLRDSSGNIFHPPQGESERTYYVVGSRILASWQSHKNVIYNFSYNGETEREIIVVRPYFICK